MRAMQDTRNGEPLRNHYLCFGSRVSGAVNPGSHEKLLLHLLARQTPLPFSVNLSLWSLSLLVLEATAPPSLQPVKPIYVLQTLTPALNMT